MDIDLTAWAQVCEGCASGIHVDKTRTLLDLAKVVSERVLPSGMQCVAELQVLESGAHRLWIQREFASGGHTTLEIYADAEGYSGFALHTDTGRHRLRCANMLEVLKYVESLLRV